MQTPQESKLAGTSVSEMVASMAQRLLSSGSTQHGENMLRTHLHLPRTPISR